MRGNNDQEMIGEWQGMTKKYEEITQEIQEQLKERMAKYDELVNKHVMLEKELVALKKVSKGKENIDKELISSFKKKRDSIRKRLKVEGKKNRLASFNIEEERSLRAQYKTHVDDEREARKVADQTCVPFQY